LDNNYLKEYVMKKSLLFLTVLACIMLTACGNTSSDSDSKKQNMATNEATESPKSSPTGNTTDDSASFDSLETQNDTTECNLEDGTYTADFKTDSSMFHVNEVFKGKGTLTVKDGQMTIHVTLASRNIINLYAGLAEDAVKNGANLIMPTPETVTYSDGVTEEVYGFDIPVKAIGEEFDVAIIGKKNKWYDHKVSVSNPVKK